MSLQKESVVRSIYLFYFIFFIGNFSQGQSFTLAQLEAQFLEKNTQLIAQKFNIDKAEALLVQEKLWQNPSISISEINLWKTHQIEYQPRLIGSYGTTQQIAIELEQLIETAGKRKKRIAIKKLEKQSSVLAYEEVMRELKKELRMSFHSLNRIQQQEKFLQQLLPVISQLHDQYARQAEAQNVSKVSYLRIQSELSQIQKAAILLENEKFQYLRTIRVLSHQPDLQSDQLIFPDETFQGKSLSNNQLLEFIKDGNTSILKNKIDLEIAESELKLQQSKKTPDVFLSMNYDRGGNIMSDFMGLGLRFDLPIFDRNKGNIKAATYEISEKKATQHHIENQLEQQLNQLTNQLNRLEKAINNWKIQDVQDQNTLLENYRKHLQNKQVTLIEFIDFTRAQLEANNAFLELKETYQNTLEELQFLIGKDL